MSEKEVYFWKYCPRCKHINDPEDSDKCNSCLAQGYNTDSHKPVEFVEDVEREETK